MSTPAAHPSTATRSVPLKLLPIRATVFIAFLVMGLAIPVLPLHVHQDLGFGTFMVGLITGSQFIAWPTSRLWSGQYADRKGAKPAVVAGLLMASLAGLLYLVSLRFVGTPMTSAAILLVGRGVLGAAECFIILGSLAWGLALVQASHAGEAITWVGMTMFLAWAVGAPIGTALYMRYGFVAIALATTFAPLGMLLLVARLRPVAPQPPAQPAYTKVAAAVWAPGLGLALGSMGFATITTFGALFFVARGWGAPWLAFSAFAVAFILARVALADLPDRFDGPRVVFACVLIEAVGQALMWLAPGRGVALAGAVLTGLGLSMVYPGLAVEVVRRVPAESRGLAMGAYTAILDLALGVTTPVLGLIAGGAGLDAVFLVSTLILLCAAGLAMRLPHAPLPPR